MLLAGDELRRTQGGNNNAYCQDNTISWLDWTQLEQHQEIYRFTRDMIAFRCAHPVLRKEQFYTEADIRWLGVSGDLPNWSDPKAKMLSCLIQEGGEDALLLMFNADPHDIDFDLPALPQGSRWNLAIDTSRAPLPELRAAGTETLVDNSGTYRLQAHSSAIFLIGTHDSAPGQRGV